MSTYLVSISRVDASSRSRVERIEVEGYELLGEALEDITEMATERGWFEVAPDEEVGFGPPTDKPMPGD